MIRQNRSARTAETFDLEAQRIARDAIMRVRLFPELEIAFKKALGYGPHVDMLKHLIFWFHPRHKTMQDRWSLYKTYDEWRDECGLTDRQVKKGRKVLRDRGLVSEKRGMYSRVHYRPDWIAIARTLNPEFMQDGNSVQHDDEDGWADEDGGTETGPDSVLLAGPSRTPTVSDSIQKRTSGTTQKPTYRKLRSYRAATNPLTRNRRRMKRTGKTTKSKSQ